MGTPSLIAAALGRVRKVTEARQAQIVATAEVHRTDRELLLKTGWLQEIIRGWYMLIRPDMATGDTTAWYANFWDFVSIYLEHRFGKEYCLSAESSLDLHLDSPVIPRQVIVIAKQGAGLRKLMHGTSLMIYSDTMNFASEITQKKGIQVMSVEYALSKVAPSYFKNNPREAEIALRSIKTADEITRIIIRHNLKTAAARLIGGYQFLKDDQMARTIKNNLIMAGMIVNAQNPFEQTAPLLSSRLKSPYAGRIQAMWAEGRDAVIKNFPKPSGLPKNPKAYLHKIDEVYEYDAYNSLSIEGYQVTYELIERVKNNLWDPANNIHDNNMRNAMAAKGYYNAFQEVKACVASIFKGENAATVVKENLQKWYQNLFSPSVQAGIIPAEALFGYRNDRVFIRNSIHSPPPKEAVVDAMEAFFECLQKETHPGVNAVLGHYFFVFIHPYMDGNGRIGRFLMNTLLASGGYPWTVVRVENRDKYISTLENTHRCFDMADFAKFIKFEMNHSSNKI